MPCSNGDMLVVIESSATTVVDGVTVPMLPP